MVNREKMLEDIFHESNTNLILGGKGSGKTNFTSVIMRELVAMGYVIYTNIHFFEQKEVGTACNRGKLPKGIRYQRVPADIHVISTLSELLYGLLEPGKKAVFIDEAGIVSPSGTSKDTKNVKQLAYIIRHFDCAFTLITQVAGSVPPDLREKLVDYRLSLYGRKNQRRTLDIGGRTVATDDEGREYIDFPSVKTIRGVPMSRLPYDGDFPSSFKIDINLKQAMDAFGKCKSSLDVEKNGEKILDELCKQNDKITKKELITKAIKTRKKGTTLRDISNMFDTSYAYVKQISAGIK